MKKTIKLALFLASSALSLTIPACGGGGGGGGGGEDNSGSSNDTYQDSWSSGSSDSNSSDSTDSSDTSSDMVTSKLFPKTDYFGAAFILRTDNFKGTYTFVKTGVNQANVTSQQPIEITLGSGNVIKGSFSGTVKQSNNTVGEFYLVFEGTLSGATHNRRRDHQIRIRAGTLHAREGLPQRHIHARQNQRFRSIRLSDNRLAKRRTLQSNPLSRRVLLHLIPLSRFTPYP